MLPSAAAAFSYEDLKPPRNLSVVIESAAAEAIGSSYTLVTKLGEAVASLAGEAKNSPIAHPEIGGGFEGVEIGGPVIRAWPEPPAFIAKIGGLALIRLGLGWAPAAVGRARAVEFIDSEHGGAAGSALGGEYGCRGRLETTFSEELGALGVLGAALANDPSCAFSHANNSMLAFFPKSLSKGERFLSRNHAVEKSRRLGTD